ncbi:MAG TPA: hypothetical protein VHE30_16360 [Polyangiaceae bacterium]|nr:hypothetical protein [Polyangiaceae bacterium]
MNRSRRALSLYAALFAAFGTGCGGGGALLHPAHVLPEAKLSAGAGVSGQFTFGRGARAIDAGRAAADPRSSGDPEAAFVEGAISSSSLAPGVAPWVGARVGLGGNNEGGLTYTGRTARVDARHAFSDDTYALSIGLGASGVLMHPPERDSVTGGGATAGRFKAGADAFDATGWGLDVPVLLGVRSSASIVEAWVGVRGGVERITGHLALAESSLQGAMGGVIQVSEGDLPVYADASALRAYGGGLVGAAIGLSPFSVALELDVAYQSVSGRAVIPDRAGGGEYRATLSGVTVSPAGAIIGKF